MSSHLPVRGLQATYSYSNSPKDFLFLQNSTSIQYKNKHELWLMYKMYLTEVLYTVVITEKQNIVKIKITKAWAKTSDTFYSVCKKIPSPWSVIFLKTFWHMTIDAFNFFHMPKSVCI